MSQEQWGQVDRYLEGAFVQQDAALEAALEASRAAGLPDIQVSPAQGKLLQILARSIGAKSVLELGTLGGYSTIWLARALPEGGRVVTLELERKHAEIAQANFARAGVEQRIELRVGPALETLPRLAAENRQPFDLFFIDADKQNIPEYFDWALRLSRPGSLILVDNVVRRGAVVDATSTDVAVQGVRRFIEKVANEPRVDATALQTVGAKGYDGIAFLHVK